MRRYAFIPGAEYAARLCNVTQRSVENKKLALVRLEFEVYKFLEGPKLDSTGEIACRDIIVGAAANVSGDPAVWPYIAALAVRSPDTASGWLALGSRKPEPWVKIVFGPVDKSDERNAFASIDRFDVTGWVITDGNCHRLDGWVTISEAARALGKTESTLRRLIQRYEAEFGSRLVWRTRGGHRRINIRLLRNLGD
jgi:hypothetical protein